ncbi:MAG: hypothetical protein LBI72_00665 [Flavobacteriaceae bacterium]|jgi:hypothetical protein|nr:hypothetical protein [Flavobacteriaceae bacterium]
MSDYTNTYLLEDTSYAIFTSLDEVKMSHWVNYFYIVNQCTKEVVLDFRLLPCDYMSHQLVGLKLLVYYRIYPNGGDKHELLIDFEKEVLVYKEQTYIFKDLERVLHYNLKRG